MARAELFLGSFVLAVSLNTAMWAVPPAPIDEHAGVSWSTVVNNPFDGKLVYDKHFDDNFAFVSMWSKSGIYATYTRYWRERVGQRWVWKTRHVWLDGKRVEREYRELEPIYERRSSQRIPKALLFSIHGKIYRYESGEVPRELSSALASAPVGQVLIRVVWEDDSFWDAPIGENTVAAWREVFR
ncbi:MAG: hypothetical protein ACK4QL_11920 [Pseudanabaenaceae cyanobacterium]